MKIPATVLMFLPVLISSCQSLIHTEPSDLLLIQQKVLILSDNQASELVRRLQAYENKQGMTVQHNGVPGDGSSFLLQIDIRKDRAIIIVTSPIEPSKYIFALYKSKNYQNTIGLNGLFNRIIQIVQS